MKLKYFFLSTVLGAVLTTASLAAIPPAGNVRSVLDAYAESHLSTDTKKLEKILSFDALMKFSRGTDIVSNGQQSIVKLMQQNQGVIQNCSSKIDILASSEALVVAKVNFIYKDFVVENYLIVELDKSQNWKITRINRFFIETASAKVLTQD